MSSVPEELEHITPPGGEIRIVGVAWYSHEAWRELAAIPEARIEKSYAEYLRASATIERQLIAAGMKVERIPINIAAMTEWCHRHGYEIDDKGRAAYGAVLTMARDEPATLNAPFIDNTRDLQ